MYELVCVLGCVIGFLSGLFGIGGSSITTPFLRIFFGIDPYFALASPLPMVISSSIVGMRNFAKAKLIRWDILLKLCALAVPASALGAYVTKYISGKILMLLTALLLFAFAIKFLGNYKWRANFYFMASLAGFLAGLLANGGGVFLVPSLTFAGMGIKEAIATSMVAVLIVVLPSLFVHASLGHINWMLAGALIIGSIPGAYLGSKLSIRSKKSVLRKAYGLFLLAFSLSFLLFEIKGGG